jgi:CRP-like cAMP-binding protein
MGAEASPRQISQLAIVATSTTQRGDFGRLGALCQRVRFSPGALLREAGQHYRHMYFLAAGSVSVQPASRGAGVIRGVGSPIGEIEFVHGRPALATVSARTATEALIIDDATLAQLEVQHPVLSARLQRKLARLARNASSGLTEKSTGRSAAAAPATDIEIYLCRNSDMLGRAQRLRYEVYCRELQRNSPHADHRRRIIADALDRFGHTFIAVQGDETVGTLRGNLPSEGSLGAIEELYGMRASPLYPTAASVCTKFAVKKAQRGGVTALSLIAAMVRYGLRRNVKECYADCVPPLLHYYRAIGFEICGPRFVHPENGLSYPLMLDLSKYGHRFDGSGNVSTCAALAFYLRAKAKKWFAAAIGASAGAVTSREA